MKYCNRFSYNTFKKKNSVSVIYSIEERVKINKINLFIDNVLNKKNSFIFESVEKAKNRGRYTIFGFNPDLILEVKKNNIYLNKRKIKNKQNPKNYLEKFINNFKFNLPNNLPKMSMMMAGYLGYDFIRYFEKIPDKNDDDLKIPDVKLIRPNFIYIHDNKLHKFFYIKISFNKNSSYDIELKNLKEQLKKDLSKNEINKTNFKIKKSNNNVRSNISKQKFIKIVNKAKKYIASGDIFQVVLSQRFEKNLGKNPLDIYKKIRLTNPSPFLILL
jgi:anthranilate synthase component 1